MSNFVCFHAIWNEIKSANGEGVDEALMLERADIVTAFLGEFPFTHFETERGWVKAFADENDISPAEYIEIQESVSDFIDSFSWSIVERENWNAMWEKNFFNPLLVGEFFVRAPFHEPAPEGRRAITIEPRMSFGTGHHGTTRLMLTALQDLGDTLQNSKVLDMGSGTGILAIAAEMLGATEVLGVEIDDWVVDNANDNLVINQTTRTKMILGDVRAISQIQNGYYDVVLANIHREVLLADMAEYQRVLKASGNLLLSGLREEDVPLILEKSQNINLVLQQTQIIDGWVMMMFENK
ncbi:MAG: 50S ribosomal protein L11 methyltransferase [Bacteroidetes bacterium]|jgi:ribosomal protein L11 methyltransferase|nr:50S ribosomal protein L11 methyltransferase [Bacteroidota bacterium]